DPVRPRRRSSRLAAVGAGREREGRWRTRPSTIHNTRVVSQPIGCDPVRVLTRGASPRRAWDPRGLPTPCGATRGHAGEAAWADETTARAGRPRAASRPGRRAYLATRGGPATLTTRC